MRMSRRMCLYSGGKSDLYLFDGGAVPGYTWSPHHTNYADATITTELQARAYIGPGEVYEGVWASLTLSVDVTAYNTIYFEVAHRSSSASITVGGVSVQSGTGTKSIDVSGMTGSQEIRLRTGTIGKTDPSGSVSSSVTVTKVWMTN